MAKENASPKYAAKCPACGSAVNPGSYRCPRCKIYFCARCGRHLWKGDGEFRCQTPECPYFGLIVCCACVEVVTEPVSLTWLDRLVIALSQRPSPTPIHRYRCYGCGGDNVELL